MKKEKGFTLVELLIVVAIIGILAAIAIPQFNKYKMRSYIATLRADLKNGYTAAQAYLSDFPNETINSTEKLKRGGWKRSTGAADITFNSVNLTTSSGVLVLQAAALSTAEQTVVTGYPNGVGVVNFEGTITVPTLK